MKSIIITVFSNLALIISLFLSGCLSEKTGHSDLFSRINTGRKGHFRGVELGMRVEEVMKIETEIPRYNDTIGLEYEFELGRKERLILYYEKDNENRVFEIRAEVVLKNLSEAKEIYSEFYEHFSTYYGQPVKVDEFQEYWIKKENIPVKIELTLNKKESIIHIILYREHTGQ